MGRGILFRVIGTYKHTNTERIIPWNFCMKCEPALLWGRRQWNSDAKERKFAPQKVTSGSSEMVQLAKCLQLKHKDLQFKSPTPM